MHILVIGGAGMVGRKFIERLARDGGLGGRAIDKVTAQDVFEFAREFMPADMPGSLSDQTYLDIIAFALHAHGLILDVPLSAENASQIEINPPQ